MKKMIKKLKAKFARVDKVFVIGFTLLTIWTLAYGGFNWQWCFATLAGYLYIAWMVTYGSWR